MTEIVTINLLNKLYSLKLKKSKQKFCSYDAVDDRYIVEIKNRRSYYPTKLIEASKMFTNFQKAQKISKHFIYVVTDNQGVYIFNITKKIDEIIAMGIIKKEQPSSTDFQDDSKIVKYLYNLPEDLATYKHIIE